MIRSRVTAESKDCHKKTCNFSDFKKIPSDSSESDDNEIYMSGNVGFSRACKSWKHVLVRIIDVKFSASLFSFQ